MLFYVMVFYVMLFDVMFYVMLFYVMLLCYRPRLENAVVPESRVAAVQYIELYGHRDIPDILGDDSRW